MRTWQLQAARGRFKQLVDEALTQGPQRVTRHGKPAVVVVSEADWDRATSRVPKFGTLLAALPLTKQDMPPRRPARAVRERRFD